MFYIFIGLVIILASKYFFPDLTRYLLCFILIVLSGCLHIRCCFWPSSLRPPSGEQTQHVVKGQIFVFEIVVSLIITEKLYFNNQRNSNRLIPRQ